MFYNFIYLYLSYKEKDVLYKKIIMIILLD